MRWDIFCRVIDNHGDAGVAWRLAAELAVRGHAVRLWIDDPAPIAWMAPQGQPGVEVVHWMEHGPDLDPGDAVIEAFGCDPPPAFVARMAEAARAGAAPAWINLEYLSAEAYVERSHGLPSPVASGGGAIVGTTRGPEPTLSEAPVPARPPVIEYYTTEPLNWPAFEPRREGRLAAEEIFTADELTFRRRFFWWWLLVALLGALVAYREVRNERRRRRARDAMEALIIWQEAQHKYLGPDGAWAEKIEAAQRRLRPV